LQNAYFIRPTFTVLGAVHKLRNARGGRRVRESVTVCDRGGVQEHVTSHFKKFIYMKPKIESDV